MKIFIALCCYDAPFLSIKGIFSCSFPFVSPKEKTQCQAYLGRYKGAASGVS